MRLSNCLSFAAALCTVVIASACSDSTSPNDSQDPSKVALHFDSLFVVAEAQAHSSENFAERALVVSLIESAAAYGASPTTVSVATANGSEHWKAYEVEDIEKLDESSLDTTDFVVAYRESDAHTIALAEYFGGTEIFGEILANDTLPISPTSGHGSTELASSSGSCATPSPSLTNLDVATLGDLTCTPATFSTSMSLVSDSHPNVDPALTSLSFPTTTINGETFVASDAEAAIVHRVHALLHKRMGRRRF